MNALLRPRFALLGLVLSLVFAASIVSCRDTRSNEERVYDAFVILHTDPDRWNLEIAKMAEHVTPEAFTLLAEVRTRVDEARRSYLRSCDVLNNPNSSACRSLSELGDVLQTLNIAEQGLRSGKSLEGTLEGAFLGGLAKKKAEERSDVVVRVRPYFFEPSEEDSAGSSSDS